MGFFHIHQQLQTMNQIEWTQNDRIVVASANIEEKIVKFKIEKKIINNLINHTPPVYFINIHKGGKIYEFLVDFSGLRPIIMQQTKLSYTIKKTKKTAKRPISINEYYTIARGESFQDRFLSFNGWQTQEYHFEFILLDENDNEIAPLSSVSATPDPDRDTENIISKENKKPLKVSGIQADKLTTHECNECGTKVSIDVDICPNCFKNFFEAEKDVDFAL